MKEYIALEDVNKPQAKTVTDVEICREFYQKALFKHLICKGFLADCLVEVLDEMEQGE